MSNELVALIAALAALISAIMAFISWWYNRRLAGAAISLFGGTGVIFRPRPERAIIFYSMSLKNTGREVLRIEGAKFGHFDFRKNSFELVSEDMMINPLNSESSFAYHCNVPVDVDPEITEEEFWKKPFDCIGNHAFILIFRLRQNSLFSRKEKVQKFFLAYRYPGNDLSWLTKKEYETIESNLPAEFRVD